MQGLGVFRSRFFRKLYLTHAAVLVVTALLIGGLVDYRLSRSIAAELEKDLDNAAALVTPFAERVFSNEIDARSTQQRLRALGAESRMRLTLILPDGTVIGDSDEDPARMENHGSRPEIAAALRVGRGVARRASRTVGIEMLYVARRVAGADGTVGVVRVSLPAEDADRHIGAARSPLVIGTLLGLGFALVLSLFLTRRTTSSLRQMTGVAQSLREGRYDARLPSLPRDEVGQLGAALEELGRELGDRIERLSQGDARLRAMLAGMVEGILAVDAEDRVLFCNAAARRLLGVGERDIEGERLWEVARASAFEGLLESAREKGVPQHTEIVVGPALREQVLEAHASPYDGGQGSEVVIVLHDITELRRLERVRRDFVANVSHELKTPLTSIKGFVETLLDGALHDERNNRRFLERVSDNVDRLSHLVTDLLSLARVEAQTEIERVPVDWQDVLRDVVRRHQPEMERKRLAFEADDRSLRVLGDTEALTQVLENLLENAVRYTPDGGAVEVRLRPEGGRGVLEVSDTGVGIPEHDRERIFERFYRVDKARSRAVGGTGLGLSIVKNLVLALGGDVRVESEVGRGSRFRVTLPLAQD